MAEVCTVPVLLVSTEEVVAIREFCMIWRVMTVLQSVFDAMCAERPRIIEGPKDVTVQEAADVLFRCQSNADPDVTVIWKKQDGQIPPGRYVLAVLTINVQCKFNEHYKRVFNCKSLVICKC